ncbi:coiled-coil domain-containing protein 50 isoform X1 [Phascolarctos cinereus]|uniref:Coiled-coil domain-containing protein 50 isoform X1 n=1 Tax=Phascolarctos cinereus TaxID=38626 RepID=A0A6P5IDZ6_PHACI|nr:coiled-coil domain-containing protein 50 isoform X1 [Phascolarctos cinereus]
MAEISIDQSKLPGVKEVCRDFAVLEDHTLAHNLQEQEIEHHLASNVQRNRLVQYDLQVAKQLQEEEDLKARAHIQKRYKDIEQQDCEIAQEIQVKLVIEAERRRRQEEKDEDIARLLQERELQEEKRRKKRSSEHPGPNTYDDSYYLTNGDPPRSRRNRKLGSESPRSRRHQEDRPVRRRRERPNRPSEDVEECQDHYSMENSGSPLRLSKTRDDPQTSWEPQERKSPGHERLPRSPVPKISGEVLLSTENDWDCNLGHGSVRHSDSPRSYHQDRLSPKCSQKPGSHRKEERHKRDHGMGDSRDKREGHRTRTPLSSQSEERHYFNETGMKPRGTKEAIYTQPRMAHREQELYDAEIARKLQEEELMANQVDKRAAQVAQDEEIARMLMAEEKKAYKKAKEREKSSLEKRKQDPDWKSKASEPARPKSREAHEATWSKSEKPARPPPPAMMDVEDPDYTHFTNQHSSTRPFSKPESSHKGHRSKQ